jgi:aspartate oxidase
MISTVWAGSWSFRLTAFLARDAVYAGTRGIDLATRLEQEVRQFPSVEIWLQTTALAVFSDQKVGVLKEGKKYVLVKPQVILTAAGPGKNP